MTVPAAVVPDLIPQLQKKGIQRMLLIASGFSETGDEGRMIEKALVQQARKAGIFTEKIDFSEEEIVSWARLGEAEGADGLNLMTTGTYEANGSQWQVSRPVYTGTAVRI